MGSVQLPGAGAELFPPSPEPVQLPGSGAVVGLVVFLPSASGSLQLPGAGALGHWYPEGQGDTLLVFALGSVQLPGGGAPTGTGDEVADVDEGVT